MHTLEFNSTRVWVNKLLNMRPFCIDTTWVDTLFAFAWDAEGPYLPLWDYDQKWFHPHSLFHNGYFFVRLTFPFGIWLHVKPWEDIRFQCGGGWALNGRFKLTCRFQSDASAAAGVSGINFGQAPGWARGTA